MQRQSLVTTIENVTEYTHIHPEAKSKQSNKNKVQQTDLVNKGNQKLYLLEQNKLKHKLENKTKARCQFGNKAMKIKLTNMLRGKERKKRKTRYAKLIEVDKEGLYTLKINCKGKTTVGKANKEINVEKINRFKNV